VEPARPDPGVDRARALYLGACRIDLVRRAGAPRLLSDRRIAWTVARALEAADAPAPASVTVVLTDDEELRELNRTHLGRDEPTDVLSFPMLEPDAFAGRAGTTGAPRPRPAVGETAATPQPPPGLPPGARVHVGDVAISVERAVEQAVEGRGGQTGDVRWSPSDELRLLVTHGVLHLCGWDHAEPDDEAAMRGLEQRLLAEGR